MLKPTIKQRPLRSQKSFFNTFENRDFIMITLMKSMLADATITANTENNNVTKLYKIVLSKYSKMFKDLTNEFNRTRIQTDKMNSIKNELQVSKLNRLRVFLSNILNLLHHDKTYVLNEEDINFFNNNILNIIKSYEYDLKIIKLTHKEEKKC